MLKFYYEKTRNKNDSIVRFHRLFEWQKIMVSNMNIEPRPEICDSNRPTLTNSAISQTTIECHLNESNDRMIDPDELTKRVLKLDLNKRGNNEKGSFDSADEKTSTNEVKSPKSPLANISSEYSSFLFNSNNKHFSYHYYGITNQK